MTEQTSKTNVIHLDTPEIGGLVYYKLASDGKTPLPVKDMLEWAHYFEHNDRQTAENYFGDVRVSTVFLGMDHNWFGGPPVLWETMIFGGPLNGHQERASSLSLALAYHADACAMVQHSRLPMIRLWHWLLRISRLKS